MIPKIFGSYREGNIHAKYMGVFLCQKIMELFALEFIFPLYFVSIKYVFIPFFFTSQFLELIFLCIGSYLQSYSLNKEYVEISSIKQRGGSENSVAIGVPMAKTVA